MLGDNIRKTRKSKGYTLEQMADIIGSSSGTLSHIEKSTRNPSLDMLNKIADALGVPVHDLIAGDSKAENEYFTEINSKAFPGDSNKTLGCLDNEIQNNISWGRAAIIEQTAGYKLSNKDTESITVRFVKLPVLGRIPAGPPIEAKENVIDYINVPEDDVSDGCYFYLQVKGDSMINSGIKNGYRVLIKCQDDVENGEIAVVRVNSHDATLKRVKKIDGQVILYPDNPDYEPIFIKEEDAKIIGKVVKVEFDPNKKY